MKKLTLLLTILFIYFQVSAGIFEQSETKAKSIFQSAKEESTIKIDNESLWNIDLEWLAYISPDQPADDQFSPQSFSIGTTYKFNPHAQLFAKRIQLTVSGGVISDYEHQHYVLGGGFRWDHLDKNQFQLNIGTSLYSEVKEKETGDKIKFNDGFTPNNVYYEISYFWNFDKFQIGAGYSTLNTDIVEHNEQYLKGGYSGYSLKFQIGL